MTLERTAQLPCAFSRRRVLTFYRGNSWFRSTRLRSCISAFLINTESALVLMELPHASLENERDTEIGKGSYPGCSEQDLVTVDSAWYGMAWFRWEILSTPNRASTGRVCNCLDHPLRFLPIPTPTFSQVPSPASEFRGSGSGGTTHHLRAGNPDVYMRFGPTSFEEHLRRTYTSYLHCCTRSITEEIL